MELKTLKVFFRAVSIAGVPITGYLAARGGRTKAEMIQERGNPETLKEKIEYNVKSYWMATVSGAVTVAAEVLSEYCGAKEMAAVAALAAGAASKKNLIKRQFESYRDVVKKEDGDQRDVDILSKVGEIRFDEDGEKIHRYRIDWLSKPLYFEATAKQVGDALSRINKELVDYRNGWGIVTVSDALGFLGHKELATPESDRAGWSFDLLNIWWDAYYLDFDIFSAGELIGYDNEDPNVQVILTQCDPLEDLQKSIQEAHDNGEI